MQEFDRIKQLIEALEPDVQKFSEKGNNLAGTRVRKGLQEIKKACQDMRIAIQDAKKAPGSAE